MRAKAAVAGLMLGAVPAWSGVAQNLKTTTLEATTLKTKGSNSPAINAGGNVQISYAVNQENPATLAILVKALSDKDTEEAKLREAEVKVAELGAKLGFTAAATAEVFRIVGEQNVPEEKAQAKLIEIATHFAQTREALAALDPDDPRAAALTRQAREAFGAGRLTEADTLLEQAKELETAALGEARRLLQKAQEAVDRHALNLAKMEATQGDIAVTQVRYPEAADHFHRAASLVPPEHPDETAGYLEREADALYRQGDEFGDNAALRAAIERYRALLTQRPRERVPLQWAMTQSNLGNALWRLGERESGTARLQEAVAAYRAALEVETRERVPLDWAMTQNNLGNVLARLGERESGTTRLQEAVAAYRAALAVMTRDQVPLDWAQTQTNLGAALELLGARESGTACLEEAVAAYRAALEERTRDRVPLDWATTQTNLGAALLELGERESGTARLEEAVATYRAALAERTRERVPLDWAMTQMKMNLGNALAGLGER